MLSLNDIILSSIMILLYIAIISIKQWNYVPELDKEDIIILSIPLYFFTVIISGIGPYAIIDKTFNTNLTDFLVGLNEYMIENYWCGFSHFFLSPLFSIYMSMKIVFLTQIIWVGEKLDFHKEQFQFVLLVSFLMKAMAIVIVFYLSPDLYGAKNASFKLIVANGVACLLAFALDVVFYIYFLSVRNYTGIDLMDTPR